MRYLTAARAEQYESLQGIDNDQKAQILADANRVERHISRNDFIDDDQLRRYGERNDLPPDRINAALAFLTEAGRIVGLGDTPSKPADQTRK